MKKSIIVFTLMTIFSSLLTANAQSENVLNNYKYVVIPMQFSFQDSENEFLFNSRVKHLFDEQNFNTVMKTAKYPQDLAFNPCIALHANVKSESEGFFSMATKLRVVLKNCRNEVVFQTKLGESRTKKVKEAYKEALQDAFTSFSNVYYHYNGNEGISKKDDEGQGQETMASKSAPSLSKSVGKTFVSQDKSFSLSKIQAGYLLKNTETGERVAFLNLTENNAIVYNSETINGTATIDEEGNIKVEYFDRSAGKMKKLVYREKAQK